ncbi:pyridoxamine 5'-phosphate oxidase family protein [Ferrimonas lipolytica]|uniref:Heme utilization protein HutZ n=1 Tax=Ferrimonas lipolytica TaxID=2724191 RepID=A0A6H1UAY9_9GAMM|nr:pyridoxamine 5'-phosphate oxidase family protein [Ferrimonas lipolytica]QIZ76221.1 heme utilization protein HutZ [Ferrimonas lipolytica]
MEQSKTERLQSRLLPEIDAFKQECQTLMLASKSNDHQTNVSYAPFALANGGFYILVSDLAKHGQNLKQCAELSVMMIQDETKAKSVFARKRLTFNVQAQAIGRADKEFAVGKAALVDRFGEMALKLSSLEDFHMYKLAPYRGLFVKGFGQAFELNGADLTDISWMTGEGHGHKHQQVS